MRIFFVFLFVVASTILTQAQNPFAGNWSGKLNVGVAMRLVLHIKDSTGIHVTMDSPDQNAFGFKAEKASIKGDSITILFTRIGGKYVAVLKTENDKPQLNGVWYQSGMQFPLIMERGELAAPARPQTPKPPYNYVVEDVVYTNSDKSVTLAGTLTKPNGTGKFPVVVLISGSGQQDRDETIMGHKPFWVIADHLTKNGIAVLRVDDRGMGKSKGTLENATSEDFANDVITSINYLKTRADINVKKIGLLGHSEGGMIAPLVAAKTKDVAFMVLLAAPAVRGSEILREQRVAVNKSSGMDAGVAAEVEELSQKIMTIVSESKTKDEALEKTEQAITQWRSSASEEAKTTLDLNKEENIKLNTTSAINQLYSAWYKYLLQFDPAPVFRKSNCPLLVLYGEKDIQVLPTQNFGPMKEIIAARKSKQSNVYVRDGLNHLFQKCNTCAIAEYAELTETFSPETLTFITDWLKSGVLK